MNNHSQDKFKMFASVKGTCDENTVHINTVIQFAQSFTKFKSNTAEIEIDAQRQTTAIDGVTIEKTDAKTSLIKKTYQVAGGVFAFASKTNNPTLKRRVDYSRTDLSREPDVALKEKCQEIKNDAAALVEELKDYGIKAADIDDLQTKVDTFGEMIIKARLAIVNRKEATDHLPDLFAENDRILHEEMDKFIMLFEDTAPEFFRKYWLSREIIDVGTRHKHKDNEGEQGDGNSVE
jgi:hypothetical protein